VGRRDAEDRGACREGQNSRKVWKVHWQRADLKWHVYQPMPDVTALEQFVAVVDADEFSCTRHRSCTCTSTT
jgi:hypothetical protein